MAKDFGKANSVSKIQEVAKASEEKSNVIQVKMINDVSLVNYPRNNEDVSNTEDLETSMIQNGFTDPIEVTTFGMDEGKYLIVSGHRRRVAGLKVNIKTFPCIVKTFKSESDVHNYVLLANSQRDSSKDTLLYCKRYKMHEEYLKESGFKGSVREEIAKRLGISTQQADRYNQFNKVILPVWDMVREDKVGMSSVLPMAQYTTEQQEEIYDIFLDCLRQGDSLTRETCKKLIDGYKNGKHFYVDIMQTKLTDFKNNDNRLDGVSVISISAEPQETKDIKTNRNDEVNYDFSHREGLNEKDVLKNERLSAEDKKVIEMAKVKNEKTPQSEEEKKLANGEKISSLLSKLESALNEFYKFDDSEKALVIMNTMSSISKVLFSEMESIKNDYNIDDKKYYNQLEGIMKDLSSYKLG